jgi:hypothetical protein
VSAAASSTITRFVFGLFFWSWEFIGQRRGVFSARQTVS